MMNEQEKKNTPEQPIVREVIRSIERHTHSGIDSPKVSLRDTKKESFKAVGDITLENGILSGDIGYGADVSIPIFAPVMEEQDYSFAVVDGAVTVPLISNESVESINIGFQAIEQWLLELDRRQRLIVDILTNNGFAKKVFSVKNESVQIYGSFGEFPTTGDPDIIYGYNSGGDVFFFEWNGTSYVPFDGYTWVDADFTYFN